MPRDGSGNYSLPAGNPVVSNDVISSTWANSTLADLQTQMTSSLDRSGRGGMLAPLRTADGTVGTPSFAFTSEPASGFYRAGAGDIRWGLGGVDVARTVAAGFQFLRAAAWRAPLDVAVDAAITGAWTFAGVSVRNAALINAGTFDAARIPNLAASKITSGTFADARIPALGASKITTGIFADARIPNLDAAKITTGLLPAVRGGTGLGALTTGTFLYANSTTTFGLRTPAQVLADIAALPLAGGTLTGALVTTTVELGHATDTTLARIAAGRVSIEGGEIAKLNAAQTFAVANTFSGGVVAATLTAIAAGNLRLLAPTGYEVRLEVNASPKIVAQLEGTADHTTAGQVRHANGTLYDIGLNVMPSQTLDADLTFQRIDVGQTLRKTSVTARTWTTPASTDTNVPIGSVINLQNAGSGAITIAAGAGVVLSWYTGAAVTAGSRTLGIGGVATLYRLDADSWHIWGNGGLT